MERIPQEVLNNIISFLPDRDEDKRVRPALAVVSRAWQHAIESLTFRSLSIKSEDLDSGRRCTLVRKLQFNVSLPSYSDDDCAKYETEQDRTENSNVANNDISALLKILSQWPSDGNLNLEIGIYSPMDLNYRGEEKLNKDRYDVDLGYRQDLFNERFKYSYIHLANTKYPSVPCVTSFIVPQGGRRFMDPQSVVTLTAAFPRLQSINWSYQEPGFFLPLRRRYIRKFANSISSYEIQPTVSSLYIHIYSPEYPHNQRMPNLAGTPGGTSLCDALRVAIGKSNIQKVYYEGPIDPSLFWPDDGSGTSIDLSWRSVVNLNIQFNLANLSGQWLFKGLPDDKFYDHSSDLPLPPDANGLFPPGYGSEEDIEAARALEKSMEPPTDDEGFCIDGYDFRRVPRDEAMLPMLEALARRLKNMPSLKSAYLETRLPQDKGDWFFWYVAPGESCGFEDYMDKPDPNLSRARVFFHTEDWRPGDKLVRMFREVGKECYGEDTIIVFLPFLY
ncbi:hypothetical protein ACMFMG_006115 [Clarireedia jacksonii]